jgi:hypothetical protein
LPFLAGTGAGSSSLSFLPFFFFFFLESDFPVVPSSPSSSFSSAGAASFGVSGTRAEAGSVAGASSLSSSPFVAFFAAAWAFFFAWNERCQPFMTSTMFDHSYLLLFFLKTLLLLLRENFWGAILCLVPVGLRLCRFFSRSRSEGCFYEFMCSM